MGMPTTLIIPPVNPQDTLRYSSFRFLRKISLLKRSFILEISLFYSKHHYSTKSSHIVINRTFIALNRYTFFPKKTYFPPHKQPFVGVRKNHMSNRTDIV